MRSFYQLEDRFIMMNNGTLGPMPKPVFNALTRYFRVQMTNPYDGYNYLPTFKEAVRKKLAAFIHASPDEVSLTSNTTEGINLIVNGLDYEGGRRSSCHQPRTSRSYQPLAAQRKEVRHQNHAGAHAAFP